MTATGATIYGPIIAVRPDTVRVAAGSQAAAVVAAGATGRVLLSGSDFAGPVVLTGADTGFAPVVVSGNTMRGPLLCHGNSPAPTNEGRPNTITGTASGQCSDL